MIVNEDLNFKMMMEYFILTWTFNGFERPSGVLFLSLAIFVPIVAIYLFVSLRKGNNSEYWSISIKKEDGTE